MRDKTKPLIYFGIILLLITSLILPSGCASSRAKSFPDRPLPGEVLNPILLETRKSYSELFREATQPRYAASEIQKVKEYLDKSKDYCVDNFERRSRQYDEDLRRAAMDLYRVGGNLQDTGRRDAHCRIQNIRIEKARAEILSDQAIPIAYDNRKAKLEILEKWPGEYRDIRNDFASGEYRKRQWANVNDIGFRVIAEDQEDDIQRGLQSIQQLQRQGAMPEEIRDPEVREYAQRLAEKIATHSDLQVPVKMTVLNSTEINAFALPGGFLFVQRGLLEAADNEAELAGVFAHEIAHAAARHGHKLMRRATVANILLQATRIAGALVGGGDALYYALRYGAMGLGLALNLNVLGKSREFELQADQLGVQYAWRAGYDPAGFFQFFDKMATRKGYATGASWFRTHPPFYERMVGAKREIAFLTDRPSPVVQTDEFQKMRAALKNIPAPLERVDPRRRGAVAVPLRVEGCPPPADQAKTGTQYLEDVCGLGSAAQKETLSAARRQD